MECVQSPAYDIPGCADEVFLDSFSGEAWDQAWLELETVWGRNNIDCSTRVPTAVQPTTTVVESPVNKQAFDLVCQEDASQDEEWDQLESFWGVEKHRLRLQEDQLVTLSSSLERQLLRLDCLSQPGVTALLLEDSQKNEPVPSVSLEEEEICVSGEDIGDIPISYVVKGLKRHEFPVIGTYVDRRVVEGFNYKVRINLTDNYLFNGKALCLTKVGMGYGKRLTFKSQTLNYNENYFWSDTVLDGYGFSIVVVEKGMKFNIRNKSTSAIEGEVVVAECHVEQCEEDMVIKDRGIIEKHVRVSFKAEIISRSKHFLAMPSSMTLRGTAVVVKQKNAKSAIVQTIVLQNCAFEGFELVGK